MVIRYVSLLSDGHPLFSLFPICGTA
jgi:hypothetical protein